MGSHFFSKSREAKIQVTEKILDAITALVRNQGQKQENGRITGFWSEKLMFSIAILTKAPRAMSRCGG